MAKIVLNLSGKEQALLYLLMNIADSQLDKILLEQYGHRSVGDQIELMRGKVSTHSIYYKLVDEINMDVKQACRLLSNWVEPIIIDGHTVEATDQGIKIGCTSVSDDILRKIVKLRKL